MVLQAASSVMLAVLPASLGSCSGLLDLSSQTLACHIYCGSVSIAFPRPFFTFCVPLVPSLQFFSLWSYHTV